MISLLNDARIVARLPTLGFFNPWLYAQGFKGLNDVGGSNPGCGTNGFTAVKSRDPVTGLGTPNFELLKDLVLNSMTAGSSMKVVKQVNAKRGPKESWSLHWILV